MPDCELFAEPKYGVGFEFPGASTISLGGYINYGNALSFKVRDALGGETRSCFFYRLPRLKSLSRL